MQKIGDKIVYNTIEEILDPSHTALVVWDVQHASAKIIFNKEEFSRNLNSIVELARKSNIPIFFTSIQMLPKRFESPSIIYTLGKLGFDCLFEQFTTESSARDAFNRGFYSIVVSDCVSSPYKDGHDRSLKNMKNLITIINSNELENVWLKLQK